MAPAPAQPTGPRLDKSHADRLSPAADDGRTAATAARPGMTRRGSINPGGGPPAAYWSRLPLMVSSPPGARRPPRRDDLAAPSLTALLAAALVLLEAAESAAALLFSRGRLRELNDSSGSF